MSDEQLLRHALHSEAPEEPQSPAITVNGVAISARAVNIESAHHEDGSIEERQYQAAVALVIRELLRQRAVALELLAEDAAVDDTVIDALLEREVNTPQPDAAACRRYFEQNPERFRAPDQVRLRHILLAAHPEDLEERDRVRQTAEDLIRQIQADPRDFIDLARRHSACPSREQGGELGWIGRGQTVPEFENTVLNLPPGCAARPLESRYGWHVVEVLERQAGQPWSFDAVREQIAGYLADTVQERAMSQYLRVLAGAADIVGVEMDTVESPLIQ